LGQGDKAGNLFNLVNPINHSRNQEQMMRYKVEPYAVAADVYSVAPHLGHGGWTWYTGSAGWLYQAGIEGILGIRRQGTRLCFAPTLPTHWPGFSATIRIDASIYEVQVQQETSAHQSAHKKLIIAVVLDNSPVAITDGEVCVILASGHHSLSITL
jgi:cyclic beta-1,2-glucan synthetase